MTIPLQFASLYDGQEVFVWSDCLLDLGTDFLVVLYCLRFTVATASHDSSVVSAIGSYAAGLAGERGG